MASLKQAQATRTSKLPLLSMTGGVSAPDVWFIASEPSPMRAHPGREWLPVRAAAAATSPTKVPDLHSCYRVGWDGCCAAGGGKHHDRGCQGLPGQRRRPDPRHGRQGRSDLPLHAARADRGARRGPLPQPQRVAPGAGHPGTGNTRVIRRFEDGREVPVAPLPAATVATDCYRCRAAGGLARSSALTERTAEIAAAIRGERCSPSRAMRTLYLIVSMPAIGSRTTGARRSRPG